MTTIRMRRRIVRWGNSYGIRLTLSEVTRLQAGDKTPVEVEVSTEVSQVDIDRLPTFHWGRAASDEHDDVIGAAARARA
jgi:antitoxin component of MazEF toxin-antitoxin module